MRGIRRLLRHEVVLHTRSEPILGILVESYRDGFIVENAVLMMPGGDVEMGGRQYVPREQVRYIQIDPPKRKQP